VIAHPSFHNINFKQAEKMMESMDQGDVIIRPSSKGENHLTVTWKVADSIYQHIDVREEGKENAFSLGHTLWINTEVSSIHRLLHYEAVYACMNKNMCIQNGTLSLYNPQK
jgi:3-dehydroquinate synthetase